ncbi:MAG: hypothetical protein JSR97_08725 [Verrucomicrobia bacterium]|nr:hypothetical protein [Verrucomicrobiota bacterium]
MLLINLHLNLLKILVVPYYRITIWLKTKQKPVQGIRLIEQHNIDIVTNIIRKKAEASYPGSIIKRVEVAMLSKNDIAVISFIKRQQGGK